MSKVKKSYKLLEKTIFLFLSTGFSASLGVNQMRAIKQRSDLAFAKSLPIYAVRLCVYASGSSLFN